MFLQVNPTLYSLQKKNAVVKCSETPPSWSLPLNMTGPRVPLHLVEEQEEQEKVAIAQAEDGERHLVQGESCDDSTSVMVHDWLDDSRDQVGIERAVQ